MNRFEEEVYHCTDVISDLLERTENPLHKAILKNYRRHIHLEGAGLFEDIIAPDMMTEEPLYRINWGEPSVIRGKQGVVDFYKSVKEAVMWNTDDKIAVADWGLCDELTFNFLVTGIDLVALGVDVEDKDAIYHYQTRQAFVWPYDERARLIGEHLYVDATSVHVEKVHPNDVITPSRAREIHLEILKTLDE
ncbi:hypothetical protein AAC03nite_22290 [Alicyclobacillus acidoterrestris]|uniref:hypothetical protein n=1 Tax=Alicyclobacillus suci TaxID=2816080 RepID=UPI0011966DAA|nr:hypothetical protein [Alicyclobacillus suci]GEO26444.1 hypothetical protein AAC03nite_22290 [Alicyclobacillus acidoterrestris]